MSKKEETQIDYNMQNTLQSTIGIEITDIEDDFVCGKMPVDERTVQVFGILHGGASVALAESLGSIAGSMQVDSQNEVVMVVEINANHLQSVTDGWVFGKASPIRVGKRMHVWEIHITNDKEDLICISRLTLAVIKRRK